MNSKNFVLALVVLILCLSVNVLAAASGSSELHVLSSNASRPAISELIPMFEKIYKKNVRVRMRIIPY